MPIQVCTDVLIRFHSVDSTITDYMFFFYDLPSFINIMFTWSRKLFIVGKHLK